MTPEQQRKSNIRLGLILASMAALFGAGFVVKIMMMGP